MIRLSAACRFLLASLSIVALATTSPAPPRTRSPQAPQSNGGRQSGSENQFSVDETLFATLAAINAAGYDAGLSSPLNERYQVRTQIRQELAKRNIPCLPELKAFYEAHKDISETATLSQYISFALVAGKPPLFELPDGPLPSDVEPLRGFGPLLTRFYQESNLGELWNRAQGAYVRAIGDYQDAVTSTLFEANGYVRNSSGYLGRRFEIFLDLLGAPNQIQVRSYRDDYYVVITPTTAPVVEDIRDAYLAYLLDPLTFKYSESLKPKHQLAKYAAPAPALQQIYKDDFSLLTTKSLIKAIDSRLLRGGAAAREQYVAEAMRQGYVLTAAFADLLPAYEKQEQPLAVYYPDLVSAINVGKEEKRLKNIEFAAAAPERVTAVTAETKLPAAEATLEAAEGLYEQEQWDGASRLFKKVFEQTSDKSLQGRAYYGLARVAVHENRKDEAVEMFQRTAEDNPNPAITAWAHVYLGRLALAAGDPGAAQTHFKLALGLDGATQLARDAAQKGLQNSSGEKQQ